MLIWGAIWGAVIGLLLLDHGPFWILLGPLLGLAVGWSLERAVRALVRKEIAAAQRQAKLEQAASRAAAADAKPPAQPAATILPAELAAWVHKATPPPGEADLQDDFFSGTIPMKMAPVPVPMPGDLSAAAPKAAARTAPRLPALSGDWLDQTIAAARRWFVQGNPIVRAGLVILFIGLSFLARYAAQMGLFPVELRLAAVGAAGLALLGVGFRQRVAKPAFGLTLQGGGVAVLYLTAFAAFRLYQLTPQLAAFGVMALVCVLSCALALLQNARSLAFAAFAGGFAAPLLVSTGGGSHVALFGYYTLLNVAILFIATRRAWRELNMLGLAATFGTAGAWGFLRYAPENYASAQAFLIGFIAIFIATAILYARAAPLRLSGKLGQAVDSTLVFGTPLLGFGLQMGLMRPFDHGGAFSALAFGAAYIALAALLLRRGSSYRLLAECFLALGVGFATLAVPLALDAHWTSAVWALEGAAAFWAGMRQSHWMPRAFGLLLQALACLSILGAPAFGVSGWPLAHAGFLNPALIALAALMLAWWTREPLPHSGSRWARGYAVFEALLPTPLLLYGFAMWLLAWANEFWLRMAPLPIVDLEAALKGNFAPRFDVAAGRAWDPLAAPWLMTGVVLLSCAALLPWGQRTRWAAAAWPSRLSLPALALLLLAQWSGGHYATDWPAWLGWPLALVLHAGLLRRNESAAHASLIAPAWQRWMSWQHTGTVWLAALLAGNALAGWALRGNLWGTAWFSVTSLTAAVAALLALTFWAGRANRAQTRGRFGWPLNPHAESYYWRAAAPLALLLWLGAFALACTSSGHTEPLPYIPLLNPTDLALLLALGALLLWRGMALAADPPPLGAAALRHPAFWGAIGLLALVASSTLWLRVAHHYFHVPWNVHALYGSFVVQTGYAILWTLIALALMVAAHRGGQRPAWLAGAGLLALVVVKLILVDLSNRGGGERIVAFIGVGALMLVVGYFAPLPPRQTPEK
ncbi:MAG: DUF2339 domain-containing protein [Desulfovibrionaceae bacterium]|nr:DUF2339 domain-containing protein [Desulfovibrionaceae bacterium]